MRGFSVGHGVERFVLLLAESREERVPSSAHALSRGGFRADRFCRALGSFRRVGGKSAPVREHQQGFLGPYAVAILRKGRLPARQLHFVPALTDGRVGGKLKPSGRFDFL